MKTFKELCDGKVWRAIEAMLIGLETQDKRNDFRIDMESFLGVCENFHAPAVCFGCAATCAVQQLSGFSFNVDNFDSVCDYSSFRKRTKLLNADTDDLRRFEIAMNELRLGYPEHLFRYIGASLVALPDKYLPPLHTHNWRNDLHRYQVLLRYLKIKNI